MKRETLKRQSACEFLAEAEAIAAIKHPGIVRIHEFGTHNGLPFFSLEFCAGGSLARRLAETPLPAQGSWARLVEQIAQAVQAAHSAASFIGTSSRATYCWPRTIRPIRPIRPIR